MIKIITLIPASVAYLLLAGCNAGDSSTSQPVDTSISGEPGTAPAAEGDPLKELEEEGGLPPYETGPKMTPQPVAAADGLSVYPPNVDQDQDNVPDEAITGHPEIAVDNCPDVFNPAQEDADEDGVGDACE